MDKNGQTNKCVWPINSVGLLQIRPAVGFPLLYFFLFKSMQIYRSPPTLSGRKGQNLKGNVTVNHLQILKTTPKMSVEHLFPQSLLEYNLGGRDDVGIGYMGESLMFRAFGGYSKKPPR